MTHATERLQDVAAFAAEVIDIREAARVDGRQVWQIALDRTAFGVERERGRMMATARSGATIAIAVTAVHEDAAGVVWHVTAKPLLAGTAVECSVE